MVEFLKKMYSKHLSAKMFMRQPCPEGHDML